MTSVDLALVGSSGGRSFPVAAKSLDTTLAEHEERDFKDEELEIHAWHERT